MAKYGPVSGASPLFSISFLLSVPAVPNVKQNSLVRKRGEVRREKRRQEPEEESPQKTFSVISHLEFPNFAVMNGSILNLIWYLERHNHSLRDGNNLGFSQYTTGKCRRGEKE